MSNFLPRSRHTFGCASVLDELHVVGATNTGALVHAIRHPNTDVTPATWESFQVIPRRDNLNLAGFVEGDFIAAGCAAISDRIQVAGVTLNGGLLHTLQQEANGAFVEFGDVKDAVNAGDPGDVLSVGCASVGGELHLAAAMINGRLFHTIRHADGTWQPFGSVKSLGAAGSLGDITGVACATLEGELHLVAVTADGGLFHTIRHSSEFWEPFGNILDEVNAGNPGRVVAAGCAVSGGGLHVAVATDKGELFHTIRSTEDLTWLKFGNVVSDGGAGNPGVVRAVACAPLVRGDFVFAPGVTVEIGFHLVVATDFGDLFHTLRHPDGTWELFDKITIPEKAGRPREFQPLPPAPMDLVWMVTDDNGLPKNPQWGLQFTNPGAIPDPGVLCPDDNFTLPCTTQVPTLDIPGEAGSLLCRLSLDDGRLNGHINWLPATYEGPLSFADRAEDFDYNFHLKPPTDEGVTIARRGSHLLEFDSRETILHFGTPFWKQFREAVNQDVKNVIGIPGSIIKGSIAIATGLFGLDNVHSNHTELHPVWAMAIRVRENPLDQMWAIFVRNWGNEGSCSKDRHFLDLPSNSYTFRLPWVLGAKDVSLHTGTQFLSNVDELPISVAVVPGEGVFVTFNLPPPETLARINGELHLHWTVDEPAPQSLQLDEDAFSAGPHTNFSVLESLLDKLSPQEQEALERILQPDQSLDSFISQPRTVTVVPAARIVDPHQAMRIEFDIQKAELDQHEFDFLRTALGGEFPQMPQ